MDFNELADDLISEIVAFGIPKQTIARRLGISRQAFDRRRKNNNLTTEDLTVIAAMSVTMCGGSVLMSYMSNHIDNSAIMQL